MFLTYRQLLEALSELTDEQLDYSVSTVVLNPSNKDECSLSGIHDTVLRENLADYDCLDDLDLEDDLPLLVNFQS